MLFIHYMENILGNSCSVGGALSEYNISSQLLALATDNAENNGRLRKELAKELRRGITWNHDAGIVRCMAHVIQLVVTKFLRGLKSLARN